MEDFKWIHKFLSLSLSLTGLLWILMKSVDICFPQSQLKPKAKASLAWPLPSAHSAFDWRIRFESLTPTFKTDTFKKNQKIKNDNKTDTLVQFVLGITIPVIFPSDSVKDRALKIYPYGSFYLMCKSFFFEVLNMKFQDNLFVIFCFKLFFNLLNEIKHWIFMEEIGEDLKG